jgi:hypothetical protein
MANTIQAVIESLKGIDDRLRALQSAIDDFQKALSNIDKLPEAAKRFSGQVKDDVAAMDKMIQEDIQLLQSVGPPDDQGGTTQPVDTGNLADHFRSIVDTIQLQAQQPQAGQIATTLKSLDVELKTLIVVQDNKTRLITPSPNQTFDPGQLSTIRMSFNSVPVVPPPPGAPPPRSSRTTTPPGPEATHPAQQPPAGRTEPPERVEPKPPEAPTPPQTHTRGERTEAPEEKEKPSPRARSRRRPPGESKK